MATQSSLFEAKAAQPNSKRAFLAEACPTCDQPIPHDRYEEVQEKIQARERKFHWDRSHPRPADHPGLSELGL